MFGYVKIFKPDLKICEYDQYKAVYCSLCQTLGKRYGLASRMTLSYDFTFLALFLMALDEESVVFCQGRCPFHPLKKRMLCTSEHLEYAADVAMLLTYHKFSDTVKDERFFKRLAARVGRWILKRDYNRAVRRRPMEAQAAMAYMQAQAAIEAVETPSLDACAEPTASFLSVLAAHSAVDENVKETAARLGYCLGRFIYLADATEDLHSDLQNGRFNAFAASDPSMQSADDTALAAKREYAAASLHASVAVCAECYEELPIKRFDGILRNVIYKGMPFVIKRVSEGTQEEQQNEKSV